MDAPALVIFDLVGTIVEDGGQVPAAFLETLAGHGLPVTPDQLAGLRGGSKRDALRALLPEGPDRERRVEEVQAAFRENLLRRYSSTPGGARPVAGAVELIQALRRRGSRVALNTGFDRETTLMLLQSLGWSTREGARGGTLDEVRDSAPDGAPDDPTHSLVQFDALVCGDDVARGRPAPDMVRRAMERTGIMDPGRVATVGDTVRDLQAGAAAGVRWNVGVLSGAHDRATLATAPHTHLVDSVAELEGVWDASPRILVEHLFRHPEQVRRVAGWIYDEFWTGKAGYDVDFFERLLRDASHPDRIPLSLLALVDGEPAGTVNLIENDNSRRLELRPWLAALIVRPKFRRLGIGSRLVHALAGEARRLGETRLYLGTDIPDFYARLGAHVHEPVVDGYGILRIELAEPGADRPAG